MADNNQGSASPSRARKDGLLNQTVNIGGTNTSVGTIAIVIIGAIAIFGTSWTAGFFSPIGIATVINVIALLVAYQNMDKKFWELITMGLAFVLVFNVSRILIRDVFPKTIVHDSQNLGEWDQLIGEYKASMPLREPGNDSLVDDLFLGGDDEPAYSFNGGSGQPSAIITPDANYGGGAPNTAVPNNSTSTAPVPPAPTPTPDPVVALLYDLNTAVQYNDRAAARTAAQAILRIDPNNNDAKVVLAQIAAAEATLINKQAMPITPTWTIQDGEAGRVERVLTGGTYIVLSKHVRDQIALDCEKIATIEEFGGWLHGEQYRVKWCLLDQFDVKREGDTFTVSGR